MNSLRIKIDIEGQEISFSYEHHRMDPGAWSATIVDECGTVEEILLALSPDECLDAVTPFLTQFGRIVSVTSTESHNPYVSKLQHKLARASRSRFSKVL